jgi:hypothetical protein
LRGVSIFAPRPLIEHLPTRRAPVFFLDSGRGREIGRFTSGDWIKNGRMLNSERGRAADQSAALD